MGPNVVKEIVPLRAILGYIYDIWRDGEASSTNINCHFVCHVRKHTTRWTSPSKKSDVVHKIVSEREVLERKDGFATATPEHLNTNIYSRKDR